LPDCEISQPNIPKPTRTRSQLPPVRFFFRFGGTSLYFV